MFTKKILSITLALFLSSPLYAAVKPTFVLVHGALFTSSGWFEVQSHLQNAGFNVVTLDVPGRADDNIPPKEVSLQLAADKVCKVVNLQKGPVILGGHSQGGALITQAIDKCGSKVKGLVYIAAVLPLNGEKPFDSLSASDQENFLKDVVFDEVNAVFNINYNGPIQETLMADATPAQYSRALHNMVPEPVNIGEATLHYSKAVFDAIPKFYIETTEDKIISIATQKKIQAKTTFKKIYTMKTSHSPFVSQSKQLSEHLVDIAENL